MNNLKGKKLLLMGGGAFSKDILKYAQKNQFYLIAIGNDRNSQLAKIANEFHSIDTQDVENIISLVKSKKIDGIFVGAAEINIPPAIEVAKRTGVNFYAKKYQWDILQDKKAFKDLLRKFGMPTIPEYDENSNPNELKYPVIVKPVDGSGAKGITVCRRAEDLHKSINYAKSFSQSKRIIIEKFMEGMDDTFIRYHFQDGNYSISSSFDKYSDFSKGGFTGMPLIYVHPSKHLDAYINRFDEKIKKIFKHLNLQNGVMTLQGFVDSNQDFYFYEAGFRLGGSQSYIFTDKVNDSNSLYYMINYALTGKMSDYDISKKDNPYFQNKCINLYIPLRAGTITKYHNIEQLEQTPGILNITVMCPKGTVIKEEGNLNQVCIRMHLMANSEDEMNDLLAKIDDKLLILDEKGNDMKMRHIRKIQDCLN